jgi:hypothetical protein
VAVRGFAEGGCMLARMNLQGEFSFYSQEEV